MNGFGKALLGMIHVSMNRLMARKISSGVTTLALAGIVLLMVAGGASAGEQGGIGCVNSTGWAYQCGDTVTESCTFNGDMSCESGYGLIMGADDITIDGNEYAVIGCGCGDTYIAGIYNTLHDNVTIKNLEVRDFCTGIYLSGHLHASYNNITNCRIHNNTYYGGVGGGEGIYIIQRWADYCNVTNNQIYDNDVIGIYITECADYGYIAHNNIFRNGMVDDDRSGGSGGIGLSNSGVTGWIIEYNNITDNYGSGIIDRGGCGGSHITISYNNVTNTKFLSENECGHGIEVWSDYAIMSENIVCGNAGDDIHACSAVTGDNNTCDTTYYYNDSGTTGCTYKCVHHIQIRDAPDGGGSEVTAHTMTTDETFQVWAAGYDADDNYTSDISCTWATTGTLDPVYLSHSINVTLSPSTAGTIGTITAKCDNGHTDDTGTITVTAGALDYIIIRDAANGGGSKACDRAMAPFETWELWVAGYDADMNYITDINCNWTTTGTLDYQTASKVNTFTFLPSTTGTSGTIIVDNSSGYTDTTGTIIVEEEILIGCVGLDTGHVYGNGQIVTESCVFNGNMNCTGTHGLIIGVDGITIEGYNATTCRYYGITGNNTMWTYGISNYDNTKRYGYNDVTINNLTITGFTDGIRIEGKLRNDYPVGETKKVENYLIYNCTIHDNGYNINSWDYGYGIHFYNMVCNSTIDHCMVYNTTGELGGSCDDPGAGIRLYGNSNFNNVTNCRIYNNDLAGIYSKMMCEYNYVAFNNVTGNGCDTSAGGSFLGGIRLQCLQTNNWTIEHNKVTDNFGPGIFLGGSYNTVRYNIVKNSKDKSYESGDGIRMGRSDGGSKNTELYENTVCGNEGHDIYVYAAGLGTAGDNNTCNTTLNYNDAGTTGCTFDCSPAPDLTITEKSEEWIDQINKTYNITYTIKNIGDANADESTTSIRIDEAEAATDPVPALAPDESYTVTLDSFTMSDGNDTIRVCADRDNIVMEKSREYNNCIENVFWYPDVPDLTITEKSEEWVDLENKTYNITYTVKNIGNVNATESTTAIIIDVTEVATAPVETLSPQATHTAELGPFTMSGGSDTIRICVDKNNIVEENNEDNNCLENIFEFHGKPDLVITEKFEEWVASNETYRNYTITYAIKNIGTGDANESTTSILIDGVEAATDPVEALGEGGSYTSTLGPFTMSGVSDTIRICADNESAIEESNETNNCFENTFIYSQIGCLAEDSTLFRCGNTVTKSCTFNGDMTCTIGAGLIIGTDGITIDGNDYRMTGTVTPDDCNGMGYESSPCTVSGIYNSGFDNIMIKNMEIKNFCTGIALAGVCNITVNNCIIHDNGFSTGNMATHGIHACNIAEGAPDDPALTITENEIYNNKGTGSACGSGGNGIFIYAGSGDKHEYCNISHNRLHNNAKSGFWTKMMLTRSEIAHNEIWGNGYGTGVTDDQRGGIVLRCAMSNENLIAYNDVHDNDVDGIFVGGSSNTIEYNNVTNNTDDGIDMGRSDGSHDNELYENTVCDNWDNDISTFGAGSNTTGDENTCDTTDNYDDTGTTGCTYSCGGSAGICGDVDGDGEITMGDVGLLWPHVFFPEEYPLVNEWAGDVDGDGEITMEDVGLLWPHVFFPAEYPLNCSC